MSTECSGTAPVSRERMEKKEMFATPMVRQWIVATPQKLRSSLNRRFSGVNGRVILLALPIVFSVYFLHLIIVYSTYPLVGYDGLIRVYDPSECRLPDLDPYDPDVMKFVEPYPPLNCESQPYLSFIDNDGYLHVNESALELLENTTERVSCVYYPVTRRVEDDDSYVAWKNKELVAGIPSKIDVEVVKVVCQDADKRVIYHEVLNYVPPLTEEKRARNKKLVEQGRPNILLLGIDSMSRLNFIRQLPKTYAFLTGNLNATILRGLTKVGDNTQPNMFAFLSGVTLGKSRTDIPGPFWDVGQYKDWSGRTDNDPAPVLWSNVTQQGYISMYFDDSSGHAKYNLQPTDYYGKPFYLALETGDLANEVIFDHSVRDIFEVNFWSSQYYCQGNHPVQTLHFDYVERFVARMREEGAVYFALPFLVRMSHENVNSVQVIDDDLVDLLAKLEADGDLDNTVLVVFGDHGQRFGPIRDSPFGAVEGKMPFMSVTLPPTMRAEKPHLQAGLDSNVDRLLSWMDMHELLMDLVMDNLEPESRVLRWAHNGLSPFREIPTNRTCFDAAIPTEYCLCTQPTALNVTDFAVQVAAVELVQHVNDMLGPVQTLCARLALRAVESAELLSHPLDPVRVLRVGIRADPSDALLQGIVERRPYVDNGTIIGTVERLNKYGNQSDCVRRYNDRRLLLYCLCDDRHY